MNISKKGRFFDTELKRVIKPSEDRANLSRSSYYEGVGCQIQHMNEHAQKRFKQKIIDELMNPFGKPEPIITMEFPFYYRNKNVMTFGLNKKRQIISGLYAENTHQIIPMERSIIHDQKADEIIHRTVTTRSRSHFSKSSNPVINSKRPCLMIATLILCVGSTNLSYYLT